MPCPGEWRNWQTRRLQVPVSSRSWGFKSPLAHDVFATTTPGRRGRRRTAVILVIITVLALVFLEAGRQRSDTRASIAYLVAADSTVSGYRDISRQFQGQILTKLATAQREDVQTLMDQYVEDAVTKAAPLRAMDVPATVAVAAAPLSLAVTSWEHGLQTFTDGLFGVVDHPTTQSSTDALSQSLVDLRIGDAAYLQFLDAVTDLGTRIDLPVEFSDLSFLPEGSIGYVAGITAAVEGSDGLALRRDLEISAVKLEPQEVATDDNGDLVLPATDSVLVRASVGNRGNQREDAITVSVTLQSTSGALLYQDTGNVASLDPRGSTTVDFSSVPVTAGDRFTILVAVTVLPSDVDTSNNVRQIHIRINEPS
jgi:hypothetical protein